jgi:hypothetical protein
MPVLMAVCLECVGQGGWEGPVQVKYRNGTDVRRWADCPACQGQGWVPHNIAAR